MQVHGLSVRSGSLADGNQLNALRRPRVLSSLQTNPVSQAAAEWRCGPKPERNSAGDTVEGDQPGENLYGKTGARDSEKNTENSEAQMFSLKSEGGGDK